MACVHQTKAEDILLDISVPTINDRKLLVATYYRNIPNYYYFSVVYKFEQRLKRFKTKLSFSTMEASYAHGEMMVWARKAHYQSRLYNDGDIDEEKTEICPLDPNVTQVKKDIDEEEYYIIPTGGLR